MNFFKREFLILFRSRIVEFVIPLLLLAFSLWIVLGLRVYSSNNLEINSVYNSVPLLLSVIISLFSYNMWQRERINGLDSILLLSESPFYRIMISKYLLCSALFLLFLLLLIPFIFILNRAGFVDSGQVLSINIGLLLFILFSISLTFFISVIVKSRVINIVLGSLILILTGFGNPILGRFFSGLLLWGDLFFSLSLTTLFFSISLTIIERKFFFKGIAISLILLCGAVIPGYIDMTSLNSYRLSDYTRSMIEDSGERFSIEYYYSESLSGISNLDDDIKRVLGEFDKLESVDVDIYTERDDIFNEALRLYQPGSLEEGSYYNFIVLKNKEKVQVIPFVPFSQTLEFEILKVFNFFLNNGFRKVGLYLGNDDFTESNFGALKSVLSDHFDVTFLFPGDKIDPELDVLCVIGHYHINYYYTKAIGEYLNSGGNLIIAGTGLSTADNLNYYSTPILEALLACGIVIEPYLVASHSTIQEYDLNIVTYANRELVTNPVILPFTGFQGIYTSPVQIKNGNFKTLLFSSSQSWLVDATTGIEGIPEGEYPVAITGEGLFGESFSGIRTDEVNKLMVIGSAFSFTDYAAEIGGEGSYDFIIRALYSFTDEEELISVRHKFNWENSLIKVERDIYRESILNIHQILILIYPLLVLLIFTLLRRQYFKY